MTAQTTKGMMLHNQSGDINMTCILDGCSWRHFFPNDIIERSHGLMEPCLPKDFMSNLTDATYKALVSHTVQVDRIIAEHYATHEVVDFLQTIYRMDKELRHANDDTPWVPGDACQACGSHETCWDDIEGGCCLQCGKSDSDE